jgi:hypothetical protein
MMVNYLIMWKNAKLELAFEDRREYKKDIEQETLVM